MATPPLTCQACGEDSELCCPDPTKPCNTSTSLCIKNICTASDGTFQKPCDPNIPTSCDSKDFPALQCVASPAGSPYPNWCECGTVDQSDMKLCKTGFVCGAGTVPSGKTCVDKWPTTFDKTTFKPENDDTTCKIYRGDCKDNLTIFPQSKLDSCIPQIKGNNKFVVGKVTAGGDIQCKDDAAWIDSMANGLTDVCTYTKP